MKHSLEQIAPKTVSYFSIHELNTFIPDNAFVPQLGKDFDVFTTRFLRPVYGRF